MEPEGVTCATCVTRGTIDFQARDNFELRDKEFARKFQVQSAKEAFKAEVSPTRHTRRTRPTPQLNSSTKLCAKPTGRGSVPAARFAAIRATRTLPLPWG